MVSIKIKFRPGKDNTQGTICYNITVSGKSRTMNAGLFLLNEEWDPLTSKVIFNENSRRYEETREIQKRINEDIEIISRVAHDLECRHISYDTEDIISSFKVYTSKFTVFRFMADNISRLKDFGKLRTAETYTATLNSFMRFRDSKDLSLYSLDSEIMEKYQSWLLSRGIIPNSVSFYIRIMRAIYNKAVNSGIIPDRKPFRYVYTGIDQTRKRAVPIHVLKKIRSLDLGSEPALDYARDMFMMSFYLRGMSFIDMAFLLKTDLKDMKITYRRRKTGRLLSIKWTPEMQQIIDKYPENPTRYLLPIIRTEGADERNTYRNESYRINSGLKKVAALAGTGTSLTLYCARHSWASVARSKGIPLGVISEGMGHNSESTTRIYLDSIDSGRIDRANSIVIRSL